MISNFLKILTFAFLLQAVPALAQEIWKESFATPEKGIWGSGGTVQSDFVGITEWTLEYTNIKLTDAGDYAKTVSTSGGRFEVSDIIGEVVWKSKIIDISEFKNVMISLQATETGSNTSLTTKYLKASFRTDNGTETPFASNGTQAGNWGSTVAEQKDITGKTVQIIVRIANNYSSDKVILDEVTVSGEKLIVTPPVPKYGVVFSEFMIDPSPVVGLPEAEYIELFNTLNFEVNVENWILRINGVEKKLQKAVIQPGGFLILCATGSLESLKPFGNAINVVGFQGLLNSGAIVELLDADRIPVDRVVYSGTWYGDPKKEDGGWSLEKIDPSRNCNPTGNWMAGSNLKGGTPGNKNSVFRVNPDNLAPTVLWSVARNENQVEIGFSESMDSVLLKNKNNFNVKEMGNPTSIQIIGPENIVLNFSTSLVKNKIYTLEFKNLSDECGNKLLKKETQVQWNTIEPNNLVINEVLFNPVGSGEDFVEIFNRSQKLIDLSALSLASRDELFKLEQVYSFPKNKKIIFPGEYVALTKDTAKVFPYFRIECRNCFIQMEKMPSFNNDQDVVVLLDKSQNVIDEFAYTEKMHSELLADVEGVSLERVSADENTNQPGNWHSASSLAGYGTPGYKNSQAGIENLAKPKVMFEPESFSPNNDGYNDEYMIHYQLDNPGYTGNVIIFDSAGRFIMQLVKNQIFGTEGTIVWNGNEETGQKLPLGVYVVIVEIFNTSGQVYRFKDGVVLTERLE